MVATTTTDVPAVALLLALLDGDFDAVEQMTARAHETDLILSLAGMCLRQMIEVIGSCDGKRLSAQLRAALLETAPGTDGTGASHGG